LAPHAAFERGEAAIRSSEKHQRRADVPRNVVIPSGNVGFGRDLRGAADQRNESRIRPGSDPAWWSSSSFGVRSEVKKAMNNALITTRTTRTSSTKMVASAPFMRYPVRGAASARFLPRKQWHVADDGLSLMARRLSAAEPLCTPRVLHDDSEPDWVQTGVRLGRGQSRFH
jgi:hypothetical protein